MIQLKRILFPTDFSAGAADAQNYAVALAREFHAELHLLHVVDELAVVPQFALGLALPTYAKDLPERMREAAGTEALQKLDALRAGLPQGVPSVTAVNYGKPFVEIVRHAKSNDIDLIVMGTHGRGMLAQALLGSVAENVVRQAPCPVLTIRPDAHRFESP